MSSLGIAKIRKPLQQTFCHGLQRLDILIDGLAFGRRDQSVANAVEQRKPKIVFEMLNGVGDGRLREAEFEAAAPPWSATASLRRKFRAAEYSCGAELS